MGMRFPRRRRAVGRRGTLWLTVAAAAPMPVRATSDSWNIAGNGNWNVTGNWTTGIPSAGQDVFVTNAGGKTVTYLNPGFTNSFLSLTLDGATGINSLLQNQDLLSVTSEVVGGSGRGAYTLNG